MHLSQNRFSEGEELLIKFIDDSILNEFSSHMLKAHYLSSKLLFKIEGFNVRVYNQAVKNDTEIFVIIANVVCPNRSQESPEA